MAFWQNVESEREYKNISRKELASEANFAVSGISLGLAHNSIPSADVAVRIAKVLNVSVEYLVTGKDYRIKDSDNEEQLSRLVQTAEELEKYDVHTLLIIAERLLKNNKNQQT